MNHIYSIRPIHVGTLTVDKSTLTYMRHFGVPVRVPCLIWAIQSQDRTIIVDTGPPDPDTSARLHAPLERPAGQEPGAALRSAGIDPETVETVLITHLHWDHACNNHLFPKARFLVQAAELAYAQDPLPIHARGYEAASAGLPVVQPYVTGTRWEVIKGDTDVAPGIRALLTPGHTPGLQAVAVQTSAGVGIIASDNVPLYENWAGEPPVIAHLPSAIHVDLTTYFTSLERLERVGDFILPGHDMQVLSRPIYP